MISSSFFYVANSSEHYTNLPDKLSMTVVLTAMNRFLNEDNGLQMAFLDGNQPERLCAPMKDYIEARGGKVRVSSPVKEIVTNEDGTVKHLLMRTGEIVGKCQLQADTPTVYIAFTTKANFAIATLFQSLTSTYQQCQLIS